MTRREGVGECAEALPKGGRGVAEGGPRRSRRLSGGGVVGTYRIGAYKI